LQHDRVTLTKALALLPAGQHPTMTELLSTLDTDTELLTRLAPELKNEEFEADHAGFLLARAAGYDPLRMRGALVKFADEPERTGQAISTHPAISERLSRIDALAHAKGLAN
jgi:predicted Zn-dependent protease